jgi:hypothetical protein
MFKVTQNGIEDDGWIELTDDDLAEIKNIFEESSVPFNGIKNNGTWKQQTAYTYDRSNND